MTASRTAIACAIVLLSVTSAFATIPPIGLEPISVNEIVAPVGITHAGDGSGRLFVNDQRGTIHIIQNGNLLPQPFLDINANLVTERPGFDERGLLGVAFHPNFGQSGQPGDDKFYVYYSAPSPNSPGPDDNPVDHQSVVAEYSVTGPGANTADPNSERILLTFEQPQFNHNAGFVGFGPDNLLYITTGDGGGSGDNEPGHTGGGPGNQPGAVTGGLGNSQDRSNLLGKVLRIDPAGNNGPGGQYGIPGDNPFVGEAGVREEIFAYGLRNPWRATFDDGRLIVADVGQGLVEEINLVESGGNYGWRIKEGSLDFDNTVAPNPPATLIDPIAEYTRPGAANGLQEIDGRSITGGAIYRGTEFPELQGTYLFGDFTLASGGFGSPNGLLLGLEETSPGVLGSQIEVLNIPTGNPFGEFVLAFGNDENGEVYVATKRTLAASELDGNGLPTGAIYRLVVVPEPASALLVLIAAALAYRWIRVN